MKERKVMIPAADFHSSIVASHHFISIPIRNKYPKENFLYLASQKFIMTEEDFRKKITRVNWFDKYYYYFLFISLIILSLILFERIFTNPEKFKNLKLFYFSLFSVMFLFGCYGFYLIPNRYKILKISSSDSIEKKHELIAKLLNDLGISNYKQDSTYYSFEYGNSIRSWGYMVHLNIDSEKFYTSVQAKTFINGFVDFGGTEKVRKKIITKIIELNHQS